jgi:tyrosinase
MATRRDVIGMAAIAFAMPAIVGKASAQDQTRLRIRRNASTMSARDPFFEKYAEAVRRMHELPQDDPRSWRNQVLIHLNHCTHSGEENENEIPHFLHWHRHYIAYFADWRSRLRVGLLGLGGGGKQDA